MDNYNYRLTELQSQVRRRAHLSAVLETLRGQREALFEKTDRLKTEMFMEQADVDRFTGRSLAALFYTVIGRREEKLDKEQIEARAAAVRYDAAACELAAVEEDIARYETEMASLKRSEARYAALLKEKEAAVRAAGTADAAEILQLDAEIVAAEGKIAEIAEAVTAGRQAKNIAESVLAKLEDAQGYGTWDLVGGGLVADMAKHDALDTAQTQVESLQVQLGRFKAELSDVTVDAELQVNIDGFLRFADYFFDGLFADWTVLERIEQSSAQMRETSAKISCVLGTLADMENAARAELSRLTALRDEKIMNADL